MNSFDGMPTVRTPEVLQKTRHSFSEILPSPLRDKVGHFNPFDFGAIFPFTIVSAYNLPVYASQWTLPDTTQDSVHGCWLGFATAAISGN